MRVLRRIEGVSRVDRVRNEDLRLRLGQVGILELVRRKQKRLNRSERMQDDRITLKVFKGEIEKRGLEEGHGEDGLTILNKNLPLCCVHMIISAVFIDIHIHG